MRKLRNLLILGLIACLLLAGCGGEDPAPVYTYPTEAPTEPLDHGELTILFTGDLTNVFARNASRGEIGYAALKAYRDQLEKDHRTVVLVDGGGAFSNEDAGAVKDGKTLVKIINSAGYDIRVPGREELTYGMDAFLSLTKKMEDSVYTACNLQEASGTAVFEPYVIVECGEIKVGFVGITTPHGAEALQDEGYVFGEHLQPKEFYDAVQDAIDGAADAGAEYVIAVGHLGTDPLDSPWTSAEVIANTMGLTAFLDAGSGAVLDGDTVKDLDNYEIPVCAVGSEFHYVGQIVLDLNDGSVKVELLTELSKEDKNLAKQADDLLQELEESEGTTEPIEAETEPSVSTEPTKETE